MAPAKDHPGSFDIKELKNINLRPVLNKFDEFIRMRWAMIFRNGFFISDFWNDFAYHESLDFKLNGYRPAIINV